MNPIRTGMICLLASVLAHCSSPIGVPTDERTEPARTQELVKTQEPAHTQVERAQFALYLRAPQVDRNQQAAHNPCNRGEDPLLTIDDIRTYRWEGHQIVLTEPAYERLTERELAGHEFDVCIESEVIYSGEFMAAYMSRSSDKVVILWPSMADDPRIMAVQLGYPGPDFFGGVQDPRADARIRLALQQAGKLK